MIADEPISDQVWARIIAELKRRRFILHVPIKQDPWLEQRRF
jgi:hypothetical protein